MATASQWISGARPRTLPNAVAPVVAGSGAAVWLHGFDAPRAALALVVALALIVGVNYANDYSDGVRGTDDDRVGPMRLVGSGAAAPRAVLTAALACFAVAALAGLALAALVSWWLIALGAACIAGAWFYTGGARPYGYLGFGEVAVFVYFGLVAVLGTEYVLAGRVDVVGVACAVAVGCFSSAVLVTNNLRDIPTDRESGKITLAVRLGDAGTRRLHAVLLAVPVAVSPALAFATPWALLGLAAAPLAAKANGPVRGGAQGPALIPALAATGVAMLLWSVATTLGLTLGAVL